MATPAQNETQMINDTISHDRDIYNNKVDGLDINSNGIVRVQGNTICDMKKVGNYYEHGTFYLEDHIMDYMLNN